ncbi:hypothetical protein Q6348_04740 [Isoptericola sp. b441]|uniref:Flavodoxin-like domain-containing protein n=1 Tax=Actinotalea lenta TaxID=3064654 RepID=A0ABT9D6N1_9CELL|nr:hypothetical protein [Isoptericola sp. b441]MDO8106500.1 hypothetical protein [Isoptericola sp. b441]
MTALVVYESMYGATKAVAEAIGAALGEHGPVRVTEVGALAQEPDGGLVTEDVDLLVVGGPTHAFGMSRPGTRQDARQEGVPVLSSSIGVREWLEEVRLPHGLACAAFDTKVATPALPGAASKAIGKRLRKLGGTLLVEPTSFHVQGKSGGLVDGELDRAGAWAGRLATRG